MPVGTPIWIHTASEPLHDHRLAHPAGDAHRLQPDRAVERVEVVEQRGHDARARHPERVAERDRAAERVELLRVDAPLVAARHDLRGERLVELEHVDVGDRHAGLLEHLRDRGDRAEAHDLRPDRGDRRGDDPRPRLQAERVRPLVGHHEHRGGAVVERAGVAGRDRALGVEGGLELDEHLRRRAGPRAVVPGDLRAVGERRPARSRRRSGRSRGPRPRAAARSPPTRPGSRAMTLQRLATFSAVIPIGM